MTSFISPTDMSQQLTNDTINLAHRARQDLLTDTRLVCPRLVSPFCGRSEMMFPVAASGQSTGPVAQSTAPSQSSFPPLPMFNAPLHSFPLGKKRRVNFGGRKIINEGPEQSISDAEITCRWWAPNDLEDIKRRAKEMSIRLRQQAKQKGDYIEVAHKKTSLMLTNNFAELVKLSPTSPDQDLVHWCVRSDGRRGLERFASREYGNSRKEDVLEARDAVFQEQQRQRKAKACSDELMAKVSKERSRRSRTFSLFMGEADAQAAARSQPLSKRSKVAHSTAPSQKHHRMEVQSSA